MATILQRTLQACHGHNIAIDLHNSQGGLAYAFDVLMASQKPAMESRS
jgi:predicted deacylase